MLELVSFICGAAVMVLEMAGARVLAPHLGTSIIVWTALIGVILASLSLGYWLGGKYADRKPSAKKLGMIILAGAAFVLIAAMAHFPILSAVAGASLSLQASAVVAAVTLFSAPAVFLGMVSPYIIQVKLLGYKDKGQTGSVMGRFFALSTLGSIVGTFLGGYWLISWLGSGTILYIIAAVLASVALVVLPHKNKLTAALLLTFCMGLGGKAYVGAAKENLAIGIEQDTRYNHLKIQEGEWGGNAMRVLITDPGAIQSGMLLSQPDTLALDYTKHYAVAWHIFPEAKKILMLGGGGYSVPKHLLRTRADTLVDVVEIDPGVTAVAEKFFALPQDHRLRVFHEDARVFLNKKARDAEASRYDIIMGDTFSSSYNIPFHLGTVECAQRIQALLTEDGVFACNIISAVTGEQGQIFRAIHAAFAEVFPQTHIFPVTYPNLGSVPQNIMLVALKKPRPLPLSWDPEMIEILNKEWGQPLPSDTLPLRDDYAPVERYAMPMLRARYGR